MIERDFLIVKVKRGTAEILQLCKRAALARLLTLIFSACTKPCQSGSRWGMFGIFFRGICQEFPVGNVYIYHQAMGGVKALSGRDEREVEDEKVLGEETQTEGACETHREGPGSDVLHLAKEGNCENSR
jgi:hypothetical protein